MAIAKHATVSETCDVDGCNNESERSISMKQISESKLKLKPGEHRNVHLCKEHYKEYKKQTKTSRDLEKFY